MKRWCSSWWPSREAPGARDESESERGHLSERQKDDLVENGFTCMRPGEGFMQAVQGALRLQLGLQVSQSSR